MHTKQFTNLALASMTWDALTLFKRSRHSLINKLVSLYMWWFFFGVIVFCTCMATNMQPALSSWCYDWLTLVGGLARGMMQLYDSMVMPVFVSEFISSLYFLNLAMALRASVSVYSAMKRKISSCHLYMAKIKNMQKTCRLYSIDCFAYSGKFSADQDTFDRAPVSYLKLYLL